MNDFKHVIASRRKQLNMTQKDLAEKINVSDKLISKWERGMSYPDLTMIHALSNALSLDIADLLKLPEFVNPKEDAVVNQSVLVKFKVKYLIGVVLTIFSFLAFCLPMITGVRNQTFDAIIIGLSFLLLGSGVTIHLIGNMQFKAFFEKQKQGSSFYKRMYYMKNNIYLDILMMMLLVFMLTTFDNDIHSNHSLPILFCLMALCIMIIKLKNIKKNSELTKGIHLSFKIVTILLICSMIFAIVLNSFVYIISFFDQSFRDIQALYHATATAIWLVIAVLMIVQIILSYLVKNEEETI